MSYKAPKTIQVLSQTSVNFLVTGVTTLFTSQSAMVIVGITYYGVDVSGVIGNFLANYGWTGPDYSDYVMDGSSNVNSTGQVDQSGFLGGSTPQIVLPASTAFRVNVTAGDPTATTDTQKVYVFGYEI
jgi:hypothetical protein